MQPGDKNETLNLFEPVNGYDENSRNIQPEQ